MDETPSAPPLTGCYITFTGFTHSPDTQDESSTPIPLPSQQQQQQVHATDERNLARQQQLARRLGAVVEAHITKRCSAVVAAQGLTRKRLLAERHGIPVLLPSWLSYVEAHATITLAGSSTTSKGERETVKAVLEPHVCAQFAVPLCYGYRFTTSGLTTEEKAALTSILSTTHGACLTPALSAACDAVLVTPECAHALRQSPMTTTSDKSVACKYTALRQTQDGRTNKNTAKTSNTTTTSSTNTSGNGSAYLTEKIRFAWAEGIPVMDFQRLLSLAQLGPAASTSAASKGASTSAGRVDFDTIVDMCAIPPPAPSPSTAGHLSSVQDKADTMKQAVVPSTQVECEEEEETENDDEGGSCSSAEEAGCSPPSTYVDYFSAPLSLPAAKTNNKNEREKAEGKDITSRRASTPVPRSLPLTPFFLQREGFVVLCVLGCTTQELRDAARMCLACRFLRQPQPTTWTDVVVLGSELVVRKRQARRTSHVTNSASKVAGARSPPVTLRACSALQKYNNNNSKQAQQPPQATSLVTTAVRSKVRTWYECSDAQLPAWLESRYGIAAAGLVPLTWLHECFRRVQAKHAALCTKYKHSRASAGPCWYDTLSSLPESTRPCTEYDTASEMTGSTQQQHIQQQQPLSQKEEEEKDVFAPQPPLTLDELPNPAEPCYAIHVKPTSYIAMATGMSTREAPQVQQPRVVQEKENAMTDNVKSAVAVAEPRRTSAQLTAAAAAAAGPVVQAKAQQQPPAKSDEAVVQQQQQQRYEEERQQAKLKLQQLLRLIRPVTDTHVTSAVFQQCCMCFIEGEFARTELAVVRGLVNYGAGRWLKKPAETWTALLSRKRSAHSETTEGTPALSSSDKAKEEGEKALVQRVRRHVLWRKAQRTSRDSRDSTGGAVSSSSACEAAPVFYVLPHYYQRASHAPAGMCTTQREHTQSEQQQQQEKKKVTKYWERSSARNTQSTVGSTQLSASTLSSSSAPTAAQLLMKDKQCPLRHLPAITQDYLLACLACNRMLRPHSCFLFHTALCNAPDMLLLHHHKAHHLNNSNNKRNVSEAMPALSRWVWERRYRKSGSVGVCVSFVWRIPREHIVPRTQHTLHNQNNSEEEEEKDEEKARTRQESTQDMPDAHVMSLMRVLQNGFAHAVRALGGSVRDRFREDAVTHVVLVDLAAILCPSDATVCEKRKKCNDNDEEVRKEGTAACDACILWPPEEMQTAQAVAGRDECALCKVDWLAACVEWGIFVDERLACYELSERDRMAVNGRTQTVTPERPPRTHSVSEEEQKQQRLLRVHGTPHTKNNSPASHKHSSSAHALSLTRRLQGPRGGTCDGSNNNAAPASLSPTQEQQYVTTSNNNNGGTSTHTPQRPTSEADNAGAAALLSVSKLFHFHAPGATPMPMRTNEDTNHTKDEAAAAATIGCEGSDAIAQQPPQTDEDDAHGKAHTAAEQTEELVHRPLRLWAGPETSVCTPPATRLRHSTQDSTHRESVPEERQERHRSREGRETAKQLLGGSPVSTHNTINNIVSEPLQILYKSSSDDDDDDDETRRKRPRLSSRLHSPCSASCPSFRHHTTTALSGNDAIALSCEALPPHAHTMTSVPVRCWNPSHQATGQTATCQPGRVLSATEKDNTRCTSCSNSANAVQASCTHNGGGGGGGGVYARALRQSPDAEHAVCVMPSSWSGAEATTTTSSNKHTSQEHIDQVTCDHEVIDVEAFDTAQEEDDYDDQMGRAKNSVARPIALLARTSPSPPPQPIVRTNNSTTSNNCITCVQASRSAPPQSSTGHSSVKAEALRVYVLHDVPDRAALLQRCDEALAHILHNKYKATTTKCGSLDDGVSVRNPPRARLPLRFVTRCEEAEVVVTAELSARESVLSACAAGLWLVRPSFLVHVHRILTQYITTTTTSSGNTCNDGNSVQILWWAELMARLRHCVAETEWTGEDVRNGSGGATRLQRQLARQCRRRRIARELRGWRVFRHRGFVLCFGAACPAAAQDASGGPDERCVGHARNTKGKKKMMIMAAVERLVAAGGGTVCATLELMQNKEKQISSNNSSAATGDLSTHRSLRYFTHVSHHTSGVGQDTTLHTLPDTLDAAVLFDDMAQVLCNAVIHTQALPSSSFVSHEDAVHELIVLFDSALLASVRVQDTEHTLQGDRKECGTTSCTLQEWLMREFACGSRGRALRYYLTRAQEELRAQGNKCEKVGEDSMATHDAGRVQAARVVPQEADCAPLALQSREEHAWWLNEEPRLRERYRSFVQPPNNNSTKTKSSTSTASRAAWCHEVKVLSVKPMSWLACEVAGDEAMNGDETQDGAAVSDLACLTLS